MPEICSGTSLQNAQELTGFLVNGIAEGKITMRVIAMDDEWLKAYVLFSSKIDRALDAKRRIDSESRHAKSEKLDLTKLVQPIILGQE